MTGKEHSVRPSVPTADFPLNGQGSGMGGNNGNAVLSLDAPRSKVSSLWDDRSYLATGMFAGAEPTVTAQTVSTVLCVSTDTVLDWFQAGKIPGFKLGNAVRFRMSEIEAWMHSRRRGPDLTTSPASHHLDSTEDCL